MNTKKILTAFTIIGASWMCQSALAMATIGASYSGSADFGSGSVGYEIGTITPNPNSSTNPAYVGIGGDSFTTANTAYDFSSTGQFNTWCVDIYHWMINGSVTYNVGTGNDLASALDSLRGGGATRVAQLIQLADEVYSLLHTKTDSAAFQLAVWEISFGTAGANGIYQIGTSDPGFRVGSVNSSYVALANNWLANLGSAPNTGNYTLTYLNDGSSDITQDVIVFTDPPTVPEPASLVLAALGLSGLGFSRYKQTKALAC